MSHRRKGRRDDGGGGSKSSGGRRHRANAARAKGRQVTGGPPRALLLIAVGVPLVAGVVALGFLVIPRYLHPTPPIALPADEQQLDAQVRAYVTRYAHWVAEAPRDASRHATLGLVYEANEMWQAAADSFANSVSLDDDEPLAQYHYALAQISLGRPEQAIETLQRITERFPDFPYAHHRLGVLLLEQGRADEAVEHLQQVIALAPNDAAGYTALGDAQVRQGNHAAAAANLERAISLNDRSGTAHFLLSQAYRSLGRERDAQREAGLGSNAGAMIMIDPWSQTMPRHAKGLGRQVRRAIAFLDAQRYDEAAKFLEETLAWHPDNVDVMNNLAIAYMRTGRLSKARDLLRRAVETDETHYKSHVNLANCQLRMGDAVAALRSADRSIKIAPDVADCHYARAACLSKLNRQDEANEELEMAARLAPQTVR